METPSEWAKRFNQQKTSQEAGSAKPEAATVDTTASAAEFPSEPFSCPACGQLLAPSCRVCVACKHPINPAEIARPREVVVPAARPSSPEARPVPIRYPWPIFFFVLGFAFLLGLLYSAAVSSGLLKENQARVGVTRSTHTGRRLGVLRCASTPHPPPITLGGGYDAAAHFDFSLVPGTPQNAPIAGAVCGSRGGAARSLSALRLTLLFPGQFDFLYR